MSVTMHQMLGNTILNGALSIINHLFTPRSSSNFLFPESRQCVVGELSLSPQQCSWTRLNGLKPLSNVHIASIDFITSYAHNKPDRPVP